jgi:tetrahydromethanopterin S-methyltransferase subunit G
MSKVNSKPKQEINDDSITGMRNAIKEFQQIRKRLDELNQKNIKVLSSIQQLKTPTYFH